MQLVDSKIYPDGYTYSGEAVNEIDHMEFLKITSYNDAVNHIYTGIEEAINQKGYTLLSVDISYEEGIAYHVFDVDYKYMQIAAMGVQDGNVQKMVLPVVVEVLLPIVTVIVYGLVGYILMNTLTKSISTIFYNPIDSSGKGGGPSMITYAVVFIAGAYLINAVTGITREVRR